MWSGAPARERSIRADSTSEFQMRLGCVRVAFGQFNPCKPEVGGEAVWIELNGVLQVGACGSDLGCGQGKLRTSDMKCRAIGCQHQGLLQGGLCLRPATKLLQ